MKYIKRQAVNKSITTVIDGLLEDKKGLEDKIKNIDTVIDGLQKNCKHNWVRVSSTPYYDIEECSICRKQRKI